MNKSRKAENDEVSGGKIILTARRIRGYSQVELAENYGVSDRTLREWEKDKTPISFQDVFGILDYLGLKYEDVKNVA